MCKLKYSLGWVFTLTLIFTSICFRFTSQSSVFASGLRTPILKPSINEPAGVPDALSGQWIQTAGPPIWEVQSLMVKDDYIFAGGNGLWRFNTNGGIWNPINRGLPASRRITALATVGATLFAGSDLAELFRSPDNGGTWTQVRTGLPPTSLQEVSSFAVIGSTLFIGFNQAGVYRSADDGVNWAPVNTGLLSPPFVNSLAVIGTVLFAGTPRGVYRSTDNAETWTAVNSGLPIFFGAVDNVGSLTVAGSNLLAGTSFGVYRSADNGTTWARSNNGLPPSPEIAALFTRGDTIYAGMYEGGIHRSNDNGESWIAAGSGFPKVSVNALAANKTDLIAATSVGVFTLKNNAADWVELPSGVVQSRVYSLAANGATVYAGTSAGLYISSNKGVVWTLAGESLPRLAIQSTTISGDNLFAAVEDNFIDQIGIYRSTDNGATWTKTSAGLPREVFIWALASVGNKLFAGLSRNGVYVSTDNGASWRASNTGGLSSATIRGFSIVGSSIYACTERGAYVSTNNGDNWTPVGGGLPADAFFSIVAMGSNLVAVTVSNGLYRSTDNGATWSAFNGSGFFNTLPKATTGFVAIGSELLASVNGAGVYVSSDNGANWAVMNNGLTNRNVQHLLLSSGRLFAGTGGGGVFLFSDSAKPLATVSAASFSANEPLAPEAIVAAFGRSLAATTEAATSTPLPLQLAETMVRVKDSAGIERAAPLFAVTPDQVNFQIPEGTAAGAATVTLLGGNGEIATGSLQIAAVAPGLFSANANGQGAAAAVALRVKADGSQSYEPVARYDPSQNRFVTIPIELGPDLGSASDQVYLLLYGTGIRFRSSLTASSANLSGLDLPVEYAGPTPGLQGLDQVNVRLARSLAGRGEANLLLTIDGKTANAVQINIR